MPLVFLMYFFLATLVHLVVVVLRTFTLTWPVGIIFKNIINIRWRERERERER
jgi:hypothetical protein